MLQTILQVTPNPVGDVMHLRKKPLSLVALAGLVCLMLAGLLSVSPAMAADECQIVRVDGRSVEQFDVQTREDARAIIGGAGDGVSVAVLDTAPSEGSEQVEVEICLLDQAQIDQLLTQPGPFHFVSVQVPADSASWNFENGWPYKISGPQPHA